MGSALLFLTCYNEDGDDIISGIVTGDEHTQAATFYEEGIQKFVPRYDKCLQNFGIYVEK